MLKKLFYTVVIIACFTSCISTKSTIKNIDETVVKPIIKENAYQIKEYADNKKYGHHEDYPINIGFIQEKNEALYIGYYFNALAGPNGEVISYKRVDTCCPFPTKHDKMGGGLLAIYEVKWEGQTTPVKLYFNIYERGKIVCPIGLSIKNQPLKSQ